MQKISVGNITSHFLDDFCNYFALGVYFNCGIIFLAASSASRSPPTFLARPSRTRVLEGKDSWLDCAASGSPLPQVTWLKDGVKVDLSHLDSRFSVAGAGTLKIRGTRPDDAGTYQCR